MEHTSTNFANKVCKGTILASRDMSQVTVEGILNPVVDKSRVYYIAAAPLERRMSYTGSGIPFANASHAFENTPIQDKLVVDNNGHFVVTIPVPNSYYAGIGTVLVPPTLYIVYYVNGNKDERKEGIVLTHSVPFRMITYPIERNDVSFYTGLGLLPVRGQEEILRSGAYHTKPQPNNFWGLRPPV